MGEADAKLRNIISKLTGGMGKAGVGTTSATCCIDGMENYGITMFAQ
jgi:hypothetical protein